MRTKTLPAWIMVVLVLAIGVSSTVGIEAINRRQSRASQSELVVTQIRVVAMKTTIIFDQFQIDPTQAQSLALQFIGLQTEATELVEELGDIAPGPEQAALAASLENIKSAADGAVQLAQKNSGRSNAGITYIQTVLKPLGDDFLSALAVAQSVYHTEALRQQQRARSSTIAVLSGAVLLIGILIAVNERLRRANLSLVERQERRFRSLVQHGTDLISLLDESGKVRYQSPSITALLGLDPQAVEQHQFSAIIHPDDREAFSQILNQSAKFPDNVAGGEIRLANCDGTWRTVDVVMSNLTADPDVSGYVLTSRDVTVRNELMQQIAHSATHDSLTGLPNRRLLLDRAQQALARANRSTETVAIVFIDLNEFKDVNDSLGHDAGDEVLKMTADRLRQSVRPGDTVARLGGDEFVVLLEAIEPGQAHKVAERIVQSVSAPFPIASEAVRISISLGLAERQGPLEEPEDLLRKADVAMYSSKRSGDRSPVVFDERIHGKSRRLVTQPYLDSKEQIAV